MVRSGAFIITSLFVLFSFCSQDPTGKNSPSKIIRENDKIIIVDNTDKKWDITHAVNTYNMEPERFQFGLGPFAIRPILNPKFINPGQPGYPGNSDTRLVIGTVLNNDVRAYPIDVLSNHEIVDEAFGDIHVAVAY